MMIVIIRTIIVDLNNESYKNWPTKYVQDRTYSTRW